MIEADFIFTDDEAAELLSAAPAEPATTVVDVPERPGPFDAQSQLAAARKVLRV